MTHRSVIVFFIGIFCFGYVSRAFADIRLPGILSDNMVLQQKSRVNLWGWSAPDEKIIVTTSWNSEVDSVTASGDAKWKISIATPAAGGPYTITLKGHNTIQLKNIMIGEVWVCSGQSNMEWSYLNGIPQMEEELPNSANSNIRFFHIPKTTAEYPQDDCAATWSECNPETLKKFSAAAYYFGKQLQKKLNVPVGLINASWGGTPAEVWTPEDLIAKNPMLEKAASKINQARWWPNLPGRAYNAMIAPVTSFDIAGVIWYQGESNTGTASTYDELMRTLIGSWRSAWKKDFPFYYVQIAPYAYGNKNIGALLRESQTKTLGYPNTGMVVITDLVENIKDIHPRDKRDVGNRLANLALSDTYGEKGISFKNPMFKNMVVNNNKAVVYFTDVPEGLKLKDGDKKATEFFIAGTDQTFYPADVKIEGDHVILSNKQVKVPVAVRFGFSNTAMPNLFSKEGLPVAPFRTDTWEVDTGKAEQ